MILNWKLGTISVASHFFETMGYSYAKSMDRSPAVIPEVGLSYEGDSRH